MTPSILDEVATVLTKQFDVDAARVLPETTLQDLGLDSLSLMEFVFAIEDHFAIRIPEERLDPRQAGLTLADLCTALQEALAKPAPAAAAAAA